MKPCVAPFGSHTPWTMSPRSKTCLISFDHHVRTPSRRLLRRISSARSWVTLPSVVGIGAVQLGSVALLDVAPQLHQGLRAQSVAPGHKLWGLPAGPAGEDSGASTAISRDLQ